MQALLLWNNDDDSLYAFVISGVFWMICCDCGSCKDDGSLSSAFCCCCCSFSFCTWNFLKFSSTSKCVKRFEMFESFEWSVRVMLQPSRLSKSVKAFSSLRNHGRWSSWTWYGVTWTCIAIPKRHSVSRRLRAVIQVFLPKNKQLSFKFLKFKKEITSCMSTIKIIHWFYTIN